jgi:hypothetical protein
VSLLDVDGWVVELMLLSPAPGLGPESESIRSFLQKDEQGAYRVVWADEPTFRLADNTGTLVHLGTDPLASVVPNTRSGIRLSFIGKYVPFFFDETERLKFTRFSAALYEASGAVYGALYARCSDGGSHHLGAWFRGSDFAAASLSLVASMGLFAEQPHLAGVGLGGDPLEQRRALAGYQDRAKKLSRDRLNMLLADDGGMLSARPGQWAAITFPFSDGNRASRASLKLALAAGLGPARN